MKKNIFYKFVIISQNFLIYFLFYIIIYKDRYFLKKKNILKSLKVYEFKYNILTKKVKLAYDNNVFAIIRINCKGCGLFVFYNLYLGCIVSYIKDGHIPIVDLISFPNIFNKFNISSLKINPWEIYFNQPFGYTLEEVKKNSKNIKYFNFPKCRKPNKDDIYINNVLLDFWHNMAYKYIPIKIEILEESNLIMKKLFQDSYNILGVLIRGTDYIAKRPKTHCIPPTIKMVFKDIKEMNIKFKYDLIFLTTEDDIIRNKFIKKYGNKLRFLKPINNINYNYKKKLWLAFNKNINGNIHFMKIYLINIIILSNCIDILCARTGGSVGAFILTEGFRNKKAYYLGRYK